MSIVFFKRNELDIIQDGELDINHLSIKLSSMRHGCIFVQNCFEELIGYVDDNLVKQCIVSGSNVFVKPFSNLIVEEDESKLVGLESIMKETGIEVLPVTDRHRRLSAAFIKTYPEELQAFDRLLLGLAFSALPTFEGQFLNYLYQKRYRKVILFGNDRDCQMIENCLRNRINTERYTGYKKEYDENSVLILDMLFSKTYRQYFFSNWEKANICTLESTLAAALVSKLYDYSDEIGFKVLFIEGPLKEKLQSASTRWPILFQNRDLSFALNQDHLMNDFCQHNKELIEWMRDPNYGVLSSNAGISTNGIHLISADYQGEGCICANGVRSPGVVEKGKACIHLFGPCLTFGTCVPDKYTIQAYLQNKVNTSGLEYDVINHGLRSGHSSLNNFLFIFNTVLHKDDIVVIIDSYDNNVKEEVTKYDSIECSSDFINSSKNTDIHFLDNCFHANMAVNQLLAEFIHEKIYDSLHSSCSLLKEEKSDQLNTGGRFSIMQPGKAIEEALVRSYLDYLEKVKRPISGGEKVGSIIMTANPITKGHEYLIEYASKRCDLLYIFVVEEDKFLFSTSERLMLVNQVVNEANVVVLTTGNLMTAFFTFPDYFSKEYNNDLSPKISTLHFKIFGDIVAPFLGISMRFVGEEAEGSVTAAYNEQLQMYMPKYGIDVISVPRKTTKDGDVISASSVRKLIEAGELKELSGYISIEVLNYIKKKCARGN